MVCSSCLGSEVILFVSNSKLNFILFSFSYLWYLLLVADASGVCLAVLYVVGEDKSGKFNTGDQNYISPEIGCF